MKKSKLIRLLNTFNSDELKAFGDFVASPYFNKKTELLPFFEYLQKYAPLFPVEKITRTVIFQALYPQEVYQEKKISYLMSDLCKLIERFFKIRNFERNKNQVEIYWLDALLKRQLYKDYERAYKKVGLQFSVENNKDSYYYFQKYELSNLSVNYAMQKQLRQQDETLQLTTDYLDYFYLLKKLQYSCSMLVQQRISGMEYKMNLLEEIDQYLSTEKIKEPIILIYHLILKMLLEEEKEVHFLALKKLIPLYVDQLSHEDNRDIYKYAINYCAQKLKRGQIQFAEDALELYLDGINQNILLDNGFLSPWTYKNVVKLGLGLKKFEWVEQFLHDYNEKLKKPFRQNALHFNLADLHYFKGEFQQTLYHLRYIKFTDLFYKLGTKMLLIKVYYELKEEDALLSLLASFSLFLKRNKQMSKQVREMYLNFCSIVQSITRRNPKHLAKIKQKIKTDKLLTDRRWLLQEVTKWENLKQ